MHSLASPTVTVIVERPARLTDGACADEATRIGLHSLIDQVIESVRPQAVACGGVIEARHDPRERLVQVDAGRLRRALAHLLVSGLRHAQTDRPLLVWTYVNSAFLEIGVRNAGGRAEPWCTPAVTPSTSSGRHTEAAESPCLDTTLAKYFVELLGGRLEMRAAARHGAPASTVVRLPPDVATPLAAPLPRKSAATHAGTRARLDGTHVLLVEDDPDALECLGLILRSVGARVTAYSYTEPAFAYFVDAAWADRPDVIVSDIAMPIEDGYSLLRRLRRWEANHGALPVPAIAVTAFSREEDCRRALTSGFDRHLSKPLDAAALVETIAQWS